MLYYTVHLTPLNLDKGHGQEWYRSFRKWRKMEAWDVKYHVAQLFLYSDVYVVKNHIKDRVAAVIITLALLNAGYVGCSLVLLPTVYES